LGADLDAKKGVLRQLPQSSKDSKSGDYIIERRAAWKIRLIDSSHGGLGLTLVQQQMERLLFKAKTQLKSSEKMREGELRQYGENLNGGQAFSRQLRKHIQKTTAECDKVYFESQKDRLKNLNQYFEDKCRTILTTPLDLKRKKLSPLASSAPTGQGFLKHSVSMPNTLDTQSLRNEKDQSRSANLASSQSASNLSEEVC